MKRKIEITVDTSAQAAFDKLRNLDIYKEFLMFIESIEPTECPNGLDSWIVILRAEVGPFERIKRLRMSRASENPGSSLTFSRVELDAKNHSNWVLDIRFSSITDNATNITLQVSYSGKFWTRPLELAFNSHIAEAETRLKNFLNL